MPQDYCIYDDDVIARHVCKKCGSPVCDLHYMNGLCLECNEERQAKKEREKHTGNMDDNYAGYNE